jgi:hypothetical protein
MIIFSIFMRAGYSKLALRKSYLNVKHFHVSVVGITEKWICNKALDETTR